MEKKFGKNFIEISKNKSRAKIREKFFEKQKLKEKIGRKKFREQKFESKIIRCKNLRLNLEDK